MITSFLMAKVWVVVTTRGLLSSVRRICFFKLKVKFIIFFLILKINVSIFKIELKTI